VISKYMKRFFNRKEVVPENYEERAFEYRTYRLAREYHCMPTDTVHVTIEGEHFSETIDQTMVVDTVAIFRTKEAFGMTDVVGAAFGKSKTYE
jgi:hypothetical protein